MKNKKSLARMEMLKRLAKSKGSDLHSGLGEKLKSKKLSKVEVIAKDEKGLQAGLTKAQQILKAKLGALPSEEEEVSGDEEAVAADEDGEETEEEAHEDCEYCHGQGCVACEDEEVSE